MAVDRTRRPPWTPLPVESGAIPGVACSRRDAVRLLLLAGAVAGWTGRVHAQEAGRPAPADAAHRIQVDVPILADDPVAVPLTVSVDHPMEPDHYIARLEMTLASDPVPRKGTFL